MMQYAVSSIHTEQVHTEQVHFVVKSKIVINSDQDISMCSLLKDAYLLFFLLIYIYIHISKKKSR